MSSTSAHSASVTQPHGALHRIPNARLYEPRGRPDMVRVGTIVWLASDLMFFAALFGAYFTIKNVTDATAAQQSAASGTHVASLWELMTAQLNWPFALGNTIILVLSSVTCQLGVFAAEDGRPGRSGSVLQVREWGMREWYTLTFVMGAIFIGGQVWEYSEMVGEGITISANSYASAFFLATGFHGLHVTAGLIAFLLIMGRTLISRTFTHEQAVSAIAVSYYWHFVDVVWVALFSVIYGPTAVSGVQQLLGLG